MSSTPPAVGDLAPDFELPDEDGQKHKLSEFRGRRVVLYFYPADDTAGCTKQACAFRDAYPTIEKQNAVVVGISPDGAESHRKFKTKYNLPFVLLSDVDHKVMERYGIWGEKNNYGIKSIGVIRSHFVIDETGHVVDAKVKVRATDSADKALATLKS
jgi:thioredoxin-dependent peroxiredoxin